MIIKHPRLKCLSYVLLKKEKLFCLHVLTHNHTYTNYVYKLTDQNTLESQRCGQVDLKPSNLFFLTSLR